MDIFGLLDSIKDQRFDEIVTPQIWKKYSRFMPLLGHSRHILRILNSYRRARI